MSVNIPPQKRVAPLLTLMEIEKIRIRNQIAAAKTFSLAASLPQSKPKPDWFTNYCGE